MATHLITSLYFVLNKIKLVVTEVDKKATVAEPLYFVGTLQKHQVEGLIWLKVIISQLFRLFMLQKYLISYDIYY